jgi:putative nucleotidyltransferase with HDIG domain
MPLHGVHQELSLLSALAGQKRLRVHLVGGFLRDRVLSPERPDGRDLDFAVSKGAILLARAFARRIRGAFVLLDNERGCARVAQKTPQGLRTYDFSDWRASSLKGDLALRDFTINTFHADIKALLGADFSPAVLSGQKKALADIRARTLRMVSARAFTDDPLRLLRAFSLRAQLGFRIEPRTMAAIRKHYRLIRDVSPERVREELFKVLETPRAAETFKALHACGLLWEIVPQMRGMASVAQGGYHHLDVWRHSLLVMSALEGLIRDLDGDEDLRSYLDAEIGGGHSRRAILKLACLFHDIGKPDTRREEADGRMSFHGHEHAGARITRIVARQLLLSTRETHVLMDLVALHLRPGYMANFRKPSERMVFRFFRDAGDEAVAVLLLSLADQRSTRGPLTAPGDIIHHEKVNFPLIARFFRKRKEKPFVRLLNGDDLIARLKLKPGPLFAKILSGVDEAQHLGQVNTFDEALAWARRSAERLCR